jgi:hypothetical protein
MTVSGTPPRPAEAYTGSDPYVFVSYSHQDKAAVYPEIRRFQNLGCRIWYDEGIRPSSDFTAQLADAITRCRLFLVFITPNSVASRYVLDEIHFALDRGKSILPIHLVKSPLPDALQLKLGRFLAILRHEISEDRYRQQFGRCLPPETMKADLGSLPPPEEPPVPPVSLPDTGIVPVPSFQLGGVVPPGYFIDREDELAEAKRLIQDGQGFLLVGNRRAGKTSFSHKLIHEIQGRPGNDVLASYLNLQSCPQLTSITFLEHTLLNLVGETARQVFGLKYLDLLKPNPGEGNDRLRGDRELPVFLDIFARIRQRTHAQGGSDANPLMAPEFVELARDLLDIIRAKNWRRCAIFYDEANLLSVKVSVGLIESNEEALSAAGVTCVYAASPEQEGSFNCFADLLGHRVRLGPFREFDDMRRLLVRYCGMADLPAEPAALARMWELSRGGAYVIQLLAGRSFRLAATERESVVRIRHVTAAHDEIRQEKPHLF